MDAYGRLNIVSSTQVPFHVRRILGNALDIPKHKIRGLIGEYEALDTAAQVIRTLELKIFPKQFLSEVSKLKCGKQSDLLSEEAAEAVSYTHLTTPKRPAFPS